MAVSEGGYPIHLHRKLAPSQMVASPPAPKKQNSRAAEGTIYDGVNLIDLNSNIDEQDTITEKSNYQIQEIIA